MFCKGTKSISFFIRTNLLGNTSLKFGAEMLDLSKNVWDTSARRVHTYVNPLVAVKSLRINKTGWRQGNKFAITRT